MSNPILEAQLAIEAEETPDTSDPKAVNKSRKRAARSRAERLKFISAAMSHEEGRAWFYDILLFCKIFQSPYSEDPYRTYFQLGHQNIGLKILEDLQEASPDEYLLMIRENKRNKE